MPSEGAGVFTSLYPAAALKGSLGGRDEDAGLRPQSTFYVHGSETIMKVGVSICAAPAQVPIFFLSRLG